MTVKGLMGIFQTRQFRFHGHVGKGEEPRLV